MYKSSQLSLKNMFLGSSEMSLLSFIPFRWLKEDNILPGKPLVLNFDSESSFHIFTINENSKVLT